MILVVPTVATTRRAKAPEVLAYDEPQLQLCSLRTTVSAAVDVRTLPRFMRTGNVLAMN